MFLSFVCFRLGGLLLCVLHQEHAVGFIRYFGLSPQLVITEVRLHYLHFIHFIQY